MFLVIAISLLVGGGIGYELGSPQPVSNEIKKFQVEKACFDTAYNNRWLGENPPDWLKNNIRTTCELNIQKAIEK